MVFDYPMLHINGTNPYSDIPYDRASVEDFYRLSSEGTTAYYTPLLGYVFSDAQEPFEYRIDHPQQILDLPRMSLGYERDIRYIWNFTFNRSTLCKTDPCKVSIEHEINLTVPMIDVPPRHHNVTVYQCLPHRNMENPDWAMWPYNTTGYDPYEASHMCCSLGNEYNVTINVTTDLLYRMVDVGPDDPIGWAYTTIRDEYDMDFSVNAYNPETGAEIAGIEEAATDDGMIEVRFPPAALFGMADKEVIITVRKATNPSSYPLWGAWLPPNTICRGGEAMFGSLPQLEKLAEESAGEAVGPTKLDYAGLIIPPGFVPRDIEDYKKHWINNIVMMTFSRKCSGDRGNVCSGDAEQIFKTLRACDDMDTSKGEIESCKGPSNTAFHDPKRMTPRTGTCTTDEECGANGKCFAEKCYTNPTDDCKLYGSMGERPITFEKAFNLNRTFAPDEVADGTCNPTPTCADNNEDYNVDDTEGPFLLRGATCWIGECNKAVENDPQDCNDYNGRNVPPMTDFLNMMHEPSEFPYLCTQPGGGSLFSRNYTCTETEGIPGCTQVTTLADPDSDERLCDACRLAPNPAPKHTGDWITSPTKKCCGDDKGEGGWPYGTTAKRASDLSGAGQYSSTEICDDYTGDPTNPANWIDNDCRYGANCEDSDCYSTDEIGPSGGICCRYASGCTDALHEPNAAYVACGNDDVPLECDCLPVPSTADFDRASAPYRTLRYNNVRTCVASNNEISSPDRYILVDNLPISVGSSAEVNFVVHATMLNGLPGDCAGRVILYLYVNNVLIDQTENSLAHRISSGSSVVVAFVNELLTDDCSVHIEITV